MTEGTKNTVVGVVLAALLAGVTSIIASNAEYGRHFVKIDTVMEQSQVVIQQNQEILRDIQTKAGNISPLMESKLDELRNRLNLHEQRLNTIDKRP